MSFILKGTNHGAKSHSAAMQPTMNLDTSAKALNTQADLKAAEIEDIVMRDFEKPVKNWSTTSTSQYVTTFAEGLLRSINERVHLYRSTRVGESTFHVQFLGDNTSSTKELDNISPDGETIVDNVPRDNEIMTNPCNDVIGSDLSNVPIPVFDRIRIVNVDQDGIMRCSCCKFEHSGLFCEHLCSVAELIHKMGNEVFVGFSHHDVALRYVTSYMHLAFRKSTPAIIRQMYMKLVMSNGDGPLLKSAIPNTNIFPIEEPLLILPACDRMRNYSSKDVSDLEHFDGLFSQDYEPDDYEMDEEQNLFMNIANRICDMTTDVTNDKFSESINDTVFPELTESRYNTREMLKQKIEDCCSAADEVGADGKKELGRVLDSFQQWCARKNNGNNDEKDSKYVPMTKSNYKGTAKRVFNTHHMV